MSNKLRRKLSKKIPPRDTDRLFNQALTYHKSGLIDKAETTYKQCLQNSPTHGDALNLLATLYLQNGQPEKAVSLLKKATQKFPGRADYFVNLGSAYRGCGRANQAISAFEKAISIQPDHFEAFFNLGITFAESNSLDKAMDAFRKVLQLKPRFVEAREQLSFLAERQNNLALAHEHINAAISIQPELTRLYTRKGDLHQRDAEYDSAISAYSQALDRTPDSATALNNMANVYVKQGKITPATELYEKAIKADPNLIQAYVNLSWTYKEQGLLEKDIQCLKDLLQRFPDLPDVHSDMLFSMNYPPSYSPAELFAAATGWWDAHAPLATTSANPASAKRVRTDTLRVGFISPDFRQHPVGTFLSPVLPHLNGEKFEIFCYAQLAEGAMDRVSFEIKNHCRQWLHIHAMSDQDVVKTIQNHQIDILVDLAGHSANNRLMVLAHKPAPIQVSWLGYVNTTGLPVIDYRLTDYNADPDGSERFYSESLYRLAGPFFCYSPPQRAPELSPLPSLKAGGFTFASFNNLPKITTEVIAAWSEILNRVPGSQLYILAKQFSDEDIRRRYKELFMQRGIRGEQLNLLKGLPFYDYLELHNQVDLALDTFPHNGHTVTCHSLWMGVPTIVSAGDRYAARMGVSVMTAANLTQFIAKDTRDYVQKAVAFSHNTEELNRLRLSLRRHLLNSPICDITRFTQNLESCFLDIAGRSQGI